jgi:hypothetical protein
MFFIIIQTFITLCIALTAAGFSIYGLAYTFSSEFMPVIFMGVALEAGKLMTASFLYRYWYKIGWILKLYLSFAVIILVVITSVGIFSFLSKGYQEDTLVLNNNKVKIEQLVSEKQVLIEQKNEINKYRAEAAKAVVGAEKGTKRWMFTGKDETAKQARNDISVVDNRITEIGKELSLLQQAQINTQLHVGPIIYVAKALHKDVDIATTYLIILLIIVFDPLAVALTISVNISLKLFYDEKMQNELNSNKMLHIIEPNHIDSDQVESAIKDTPLTEEQIQHTQLLDDVNKRKQLIDDIRYNN